MVDVDDNDDHTVTDDERIRLVSGLKMRPDSTAFARAARGARDEGIREQYPSGDKPSRVFVLDRLKDDDDDDDDETDVESSICVDA